MTLHLFNTLTRETEEFQPREEGTVTFYSCGQTIYDDLHVGNARAYVVWDTLRRYLEWTGYTVRHVQNITDVGHLTDDADQGEDKVEKRARELGLEPMELVEDQLARYFRDTAALNVGRGYDEEVGGGEGDPGAATGRQDIMPRATGHITEMINYVQRIIDNGYAYEVDGNVYFDVEAFAADHPYAELAKKDLSQLKEEAQSRVEPDENKKNQFDFALWLDAEGTGHLMTWDASFDVDGDRVRTTGYPGWHLECTVMSQKYLGDEFDIHAGGKDHIFPHHPNERAQARAATGSGMARYWLHNEFITVSGDKMAKSEGNFHTVRELLEQGYSGDALRLYLVSAHYRSAFDFSLDGVEQAAKELETVRHAVQRVEKVDGEAPGDAGDPGSTDAERSVRGEPADIDVDAVRSAFADAMDDDLHTADAKKALLGLAHDINAAVEDGKSVPADARDALVELFGVLGVDVAPQVSAEEARMADLLVELRDHFRDADDYETADRIRDAIESAGFTVEDTEQGGIWLKN